MEIHMHEDGIITVKLDTIIPMSPKQTEEIRYTKSEYIKSLRNEHPNSVTIKAEYTVIRINIEENGKQAKVKNINYFLYDEGFDTPDGMVTLKGELKGLCDDNVLITETGLIQFNKSNCNMEYQLMEKK